MSDCKYAVIERDVSVYDEKFEFGDRGKLEAAVPV
jgi:hypothetical protein